MESVRPAYLQAQFAASGQRRGPCRRWCGREQRLRHTQDETIGGCRQYQRAKPARDQVGQVSGPGCQLVDCLLFWRE